MKITIKKPYVFFYTPLVTILFFFSCRFDNKLQLATNLLPAKTEANKIPGLPIVKSTKSPDAATILSKSQVPILCYHQVRDWKPTDSKRARDYIVPVAVFREQMKILADSGFTTILPDQLYNYLIAGDPLPAKPIMITFDDTDLDQYTVALPEMNKYGFKGVFFIMTVALGKPRYMSREHVKELADAGHTIGSHTWDHKNVKQYNETDWITQVEKPSRQLQEITGKRIEYFAFPFGLWKPEVIPQLKQRGFVAAFQLTDKRDPQDPIYTIRRTIVPGQWDGQTMLKVMKRSFP
jgi:peptidoglycan/xylan/chitin deacetylase (PgdA/CDA1 family)